MIDDWMAAMVKAAYVFIITVAGILMRHAHAAATTGKMEWRIFGIACLTAPALGVMAGGLTEILGAEGMIQWAIIALTGFLGPAFIHATALTISSKLLKKNLP